MLACPNFSGNYLNEITYELTTITQESCNALEYRFENGLVAKVLTDGIEYLVNKFDVEDETIEIYQTNLFTADKLITTGRFQAISDDGPTESHSSRAESFLDASNNLIRVSYFEDGTSEKTTFIRDDSI